MKLSVVIPTLNEGENIAACVASARQVSAGWGGRVEIIVADGGSQDQTAESARSSGAVVVVSAPGRGKQLHEGVRHATGDVILLLHADTRLSPEAGTQMAEALQDERVGCGAFRQQIEAEGMVYRWIEAGNALRVRLLGMAYGDQAIFARRAWIEAIGGVPPLPLMEDVELMRRLGRHGRPVLLDGPLRISARRWQQNGIVRQTIKNWGLVTAYRLGISPERLARWYRPHRRG